MTNRTLLIVIALILIIAVLAAGPIYIGYHSLWIILIIVLVAVLLARGL